MAEKDYFQEALSNFTHEVASGGAIRHLADLGYTVKQISEKLDFPTPYERIQRAVWERLLEVGVILTEEPGKGKPKEKVRYVREYDRFGKSSFRRVAELDSGQAAEELRWRERYVPAEEGERAAALLRESFSRNSADKAYMSCDFGLTVYRSPEVYARMLQCLDRGQREYVEGLPWEKRVVYHRLDARMREILVRLCRAGLYQGECYFPETKDKIRVERFGMEIKWKSDMQP